MTKRLAFLSLRLCASASIAPLLLTAQSLEVTSGLSGMVDRYLTAMAQQQWTARAASVARIRTAAGVRERQQYIRKKLLEEVGGFPEKSPLNARVTGKLERDGYRVEKLIYESQPRYFVTANVYVPTTGAGPFPAVLGTAGHSLDGKAERLYQRAWIGLVKRGFVVLAYDPPGQGERLEYFNPQTGKSSLPGGGTGEHSMAGVQCLLTGTNIARYFIWDGMRALDYLLTRPEVDPKRIGVAGNSGGGTQSTYLAAFEPRLAAAAPSCYVTSWEKLWPGPGPQDAEQDFAGFLADGLDFPDFLIAFAPKPIQMATATRDFFPIDGARATYAAARRIFELMGAGDHMGFFEFDDTHGWSQPRREATYRWFARWLQKREDSGAEAEAAIETPEALNSTETGQVGTALKSETVQSLNAALAERIYAKRAGAGGKNIPALVTARFGIPATRGVPAWDKRGEVPREGYKIEKIEMQPEPSITVPALAFVPSGGSQQKPAVLWVDPRGKAADEQSIASLVRAGNVVLAVDPRGWGESAGGRSNQTAMRALLVGKTLPGMQVSDLLRAFDYLAARHDVDVHRIAAIGKGDGGVLTLLAASLEPRIRKVACEQSATSYMELVRMKLHPDIMGIVAPGVLRDFDLPDVEASVRPRTVWRVAAEKPDYAAWLHW